MPLSIINSIASWFLKQRIHQIELFLKYPNEVQEELLMNLLRSAENTTVGKQYDYGSKIVCSICRTRSYFEL